MSYEETEKKVLCSVESIVSVRKHINADRLYVARVLGYDVIINLEAFGSPANLEDFVGVKGLMFFVDAVIPADLSNSPHFSYLSDSHMGKDYPATRGVLTGTFRLSHHCQGALSWDQV